MLPILLFIGRPCRFFRTCFIVIMQLFIFISRLLSLPEIWHQTSSAELLLDLMMVKIDADTIFLTTAQEIAVILPGDGDQPTGARDVILHRQGGRLQQINDLHPLYPSLHYVLLFPTGQLEWHPNILYAGRQNQNTRNTVTQSEFFQYRLHPRQDESSHIFMAGKLF